MRGGLSSTDDAYVLIVFRIRIDVNDQKNYHRADEPDRVPTFLSIREPIRHDKMKGIVPNMPRDFERNAMLHKIASSFLRIPVELQ